jgi:hypothetical protein
MQRGLTHRVSQARVLSIAARLVALDATDAPEAYIDEVVATMNAHVAERYENSRVLFAGEAPLIYGVHRLRALLDD